MRIILTAALLFIFVISGCQEIKERATEKINEKIDKTIDENLKKVDSTLNKVQEELDSISRRTGKDLDSIKVQLDSAKRKSKEIIEEQTKKYKK